MLHAGESNFSDWFQHHAECVFEIYQNANCFFGIPECVLWCRFDIKSLMHQYAACDVCIKIRASYALSLSRSLKISVAQHQHSIACTGPAASTLDMRLPGIHDVNLVSHTMSNGTTSVARSRGLSKTEKPTQDAPARAECPVSATKSAPSGSRSAQNAPVS